MNNLFSVFDPRSLLSLELNWLLAIFLSTLLPATVWMAPSRYYALLSVTKSKIFSEFNAILSSTAPGSTTVCMGLIAFILYTNSIGLLPYTFTNSSHLTFCVSLALPLWIGHMVMASLKTPASVLSHLVPSGSPMALAPFMVIIEMISNIIRPLTLSVRLTANMVAGHLLLSLASASCSSSPLIVLFTIFSALILLILLESAVAMIQAYVFSILNILYLKEVDNNLLSA